MKAGTQTRRAEQARETEYARRARLRAAANTKLIALRGKRLLCEGAPLDEWEQALAWRLEWENYLLRVKETGNV